MSPFTCIQNLASVICILFLAVNLSAQTNSGSSNPNSAETQATPTPAPAPSPLPGHNSDLVGLASTTCASDQSSSLPFLAKDFTLPSIIKVTDLKDLKIPQDKSRANVAFIFHLTNWTSDSATHLTSSDWYVYHMKGNSLVQSPVLYGQTDAVLIGIQSIPPSLLNKFTIVYALSVTPKTPENLANVATLLGAISGVKGGPFKEVKSVQCFEVVTIKQDNQNITAPFDVTISSSFEPGDKPVRPTAKPGDSIDCSTTTSEKPCSIARTFSILDREWWDLSLGLSVPGLTEVKFGNNNGTVTRSTTLHTDVYVFASLYPAFWWKPKDSYWPHFDLGIPVTGTPLHRPFFGLAERIPGSKKIFKVPVSFYGGYSRLIETIPSTFGPGSKPPDANAFMKDLHQHVSWKGVWGFEFPVTSLINKIGKK